FPRLTIIKIMAFMTISGIICCISLAKSRSLGVEIKTLKEFHTQSQSIPPHANISANIDELQNKRTIEFITAAGGIFFFLASLYFLHLNIKNAYCFRILGQHLSFQLNVHSGDILKIGPIENLTDTALLADLDYN